LSVNRGASDQRTAAIPKPDHAGPDDSDPGAADPDEGATVWLLRSRGCWQAAAALLEPAAAHSPDAALARAELLIERSLFENQGWGEAESALRLAEAGARVDAARAAAACARGYLAYCATLLRVHDRLDEAQMALGRASAMLPPDAAGRPLLDFRRGLVAENLLKDPVAALAAYRRAHAGAEQAQDDLLLSYTWRHLASIAQHDGNLAGARHGFAESLRLRERTGFAIGIAPALVSLAGVSPSPEAAVLREQARRLIHAFGGVPVGGPAAPERQNT
jgi:tetratricopeptide (TPR) repeat protein